MSFFTIKDVSNPVLPLKIFDEIAEFFFSGTKPFYTISVSLQE